MDSKTNETRKIVNFTIIAHIDHGKSTLADSILKLCGAIDQQEKKTQILDNMKLEQEKGITIKAQTVRLYWKDYILNLIDTPGHYDFAYEVSRSLAACENSLLLIDASKGVEAQTVANLYKALEADHHIIPVLNKIDLPTADIDGSLTELAALGFQNDIQRISAKQNIGVSDLLDFLVINAKPPKHSEYDSLRALIIDSWYDKYFGVVTLVRIMDGEVKPGMKLKACSKGTFFNVLQVGVFLPKLTKCDSLLSGDIGYIITQVKNPAEFSVGDTLTLHNMTLPALPGFKPVKPLVFCVFYPEEAQDCQLLEEALQKYKLNDAAFIFETKTSNLHGISFRCGFLGLLHMEIVVERIFREYGITVIPTSPTVIYKVMTNKEEEHLVYDPNQWPEGQVSSIDEPEVLCKLFISSKYIGAVMSICMGRRALDLELNVMGDKATITCKLPLAEIIVDFSDVLQSTTSGYGSFEYDLIGYRKSNICKLYTTINGDMKAELSILTHVDNAKPLASNMITELEKIIPRGQAEIHIQIHCETYRIGVASSYAGFKIGGTSIIASTKIKPYRKDVIAGCYGGDVSRKNKLLDKQKAGKDKRLGHADIRIPVDSYKKIIAFKKN